MFKSLFIFCLLTTTFFAANAQVNLVPNPSFEELDACPRWLGDIHFKDWFSSRETPDCYNKNCSVATCQVPNNYFGFQHPISNIEKGYAGLIFYRPSGVREHIGCKLSNSLTIGQKYFVSLIVSKADSSPFINRCFIENIGVLFSATKYIEDSISYNPSPILNHTHIQSNFIVSDTLYWIKIKGSFIADSAYQYIYLGNFYDSSHTIVSANYSTIDCEAYYYLDNVCVSTDSAFAYNYTYTALSEITSKNNEVKVAPNPASNVIEITLTLNSKCMEITNIYGQNILSEKLNSNTETIKKDITDIQDGLYFLTIKTNQNFQTIKFIKQ